MPKQITRSLAKAQAGLNRQLSDQSFWSWPFSTLLTGASDVSANRFGQLIEIGRVIDSAPEIESAVSKTCRSRTNLRIRWSAFADCVWHD